MSDDLDIPAAGLYRVPRRRGMDPGTKRLAIIAGGLGAALLAVVGVWSLGGHRSSHLPVVEADTRPIRVKPENPGGLQVAGANDEILSGDAGPQNGKLAPPPESPEPQALRPKEEAAARPAVAAPAPVAPPASATQPAASASSAPVFAPAAPPVARVAPGPEPKAAAGAQAPHQIAAAASSGAAHAPEVQLAALGSEEAAKTEWERLAKKMPDLLKGRRPAVVKAERDGRAVWRLRTGGFSDIAQATAFCEHVRSKGGGCSIASF